MKNLSTKKHGYVTNDIKAGGAESICLKLLKIKAPPAPKLGRTNV